MEVPAFCIAEWGHWAPVGTFYIKIGTELVYHRSWGWGRGVPTIEECEHDEADRFPTSTKPDQTQGPYFQVLWVTLRREKKKNPGQTGLEKEKFPSKRSIYQ